MAGLGAGLAFPLGGGVASPYIVNLAPSPEQVGAGLTEPIRMSIRDVESHVVSGLIQIVIGYSKVSGDGTKLFDKDLPRTKLSSTEPGTVDPEKASLTVVAGGVEIIKTLATAQRSVYFTSIDAGVGYEDAMVTAVLTPDTVTIGQPGAVLGLENGPRNTASYLFFDNPSGTPQVHLKGPADSAGVHVPDVEIPYDWTSERRYVLVWNEISSQVEVYAIDEVNNQTTILHVEPISSFQQFDTDPGLSTPQRGKASELTAVYGIEGAIGDQVTIQNIAVTRDVGFPIIGGSRPGYFYTTRRTDETVRFEEGDPRKIPISSWFGPNDDVFPTPDPSGSVIVLKDDNSPRLVKVTSNTNVALHREEPGLLGSNVNGFMVEMEFFATPTLVSSGRFTGMGVLLWDGASVFAIQLLEGDIRTVGLLNEVADSQSIGSHVLPTTNVDWSSPTRFRFTVDVRRGVMEMFLEDDLLTPIMSRTFDRADLPVGADFGLSGVPASIAFGHIFEVPTAGSFDLKKLKYSTLYQAWEARDGALPDVPPSNPLWLLTTSGFSEISPLSGIHLLGGGVGPTPLPYYILGGSGPSGSSVIQDDQLVITSNPGETQVYFRSAPLGPDQGVVFETRLQITDHKPKARTGTMIILDDGLKAYILSFVDTDIGKFVGVAIQAGLGSFVEKVGTDGVPETLSFPIDWDQPHTYRIERRPLDGLYIYVDNDQEPALTILDSARVDFPTSQFMSPIVSFGQFSTEGSVSKWDFVRTMFSRGYEVSFKKVATTPQLEEDIRDTQAVVVAFAEDLDP